ncbi:50S ribosomal protein L18 [Chloroflexota bacterium]
MMGNNEARKARIRRHTRARNKLAGTTDRPRLCVFRSLNHVYAQIIDDSRGHTLVAASTKDKETASDFSKNNKTAQSELVGQMLAKKAMADGIKQVVFDKGGYKYHGRVKALADGARKEGLKF